MGSEQALADGVWRYALRTPTLPPAETTNTLVVAGETSVAVIEPGCPDPVESEPLYRRLDALRSAGKALEWIVPTHQHGDHIGGVSELRERFGGQVAVHAETNVRVPFEADRIVSDGDRLELGNCPLDFVFTPGHAPGHMLVWLPTHELGHGGDLVASEGTIIVDLRDGGDMGVYIDTLRRVSARFKGEWRGARLVPAHGEVLDDPASLCDFYVAHRLGREARVLEGLGDESLTVAELVPRAYADKPSHIWPLACFALEAHLAKLIDEGRVLREGERVRVVSP